jgi:hypothetical protein
MDAQTVAVAALQALVQQDAAGHMAWVDDEVTVEFSPKPIARGTFAYFESVALALTPGAGLRVLAYRLSQVDSADSGTEWSRAFLDIETRRDGKIFGRGSGEKTINEAETWYGISGDRIVHVKTINKPRVFRLNI